MYIVIIFIRILTAMYRLYSCGCVCVCVSAVHIAIYSLYSCGCVFVCRQFIWQCTVCTAVASRLFYSYNLMKSIAVSLHCMVMVLLEAAVVYCLLDYIVK